MQMLYTLMFGYQWENQMKFGKARIKLLKPYQVNKEVMDNGNKDAKFMHCLPALP